MTVELFLQPAKNYYEHRMHEGNNLLSPFRKKQLKQKNTKENILCITDILKTITIERVEIFKIHNLAEKKYRSLNKKINQFKNISDEEMEKLKKELEKYIKTVEIISL